MGATQVSLISGARRVPSNAATTNRRDTVAKVIIDDAGGRAPRIEDCRLKAAGALHAAIAAIDVRAVNFPV
jgi:hypothetical protein